MPDNPKTPAPAEPAPLPDARPENDGAEDLERQIADLQKRFPRMPREQILRFLDSATSDIHVVPPRLEPPSDAKNDGARDMLEDADHIGLPLVFDEDGNVVSGRDPLGEE